MFPATTSSLSRCSRWCRRIVNAEPRIVGDEIVELQTMHTDLHTGMGTV